MYRSRYIHIAEQDLPLYEDYESMRYFLLQLVQHVCRRNLGRDDRSRVLPEYLLGAELGVSAIVIQLPYIYFATPSPFA
jgi:hypothetical protein